MVFCSFESSFSFVNQYFVRVQEFDKFKFFIELKLSWSNSSVCEVIFALKILWKTFAFNKLKELFQIELKLVFYTADARGVQNTATFQCILPMEKPDFFCIRRIEIAYCDSVGCLGRQLGFCMCF